MGGGGETATDRPTPVAKQRAENRLAACLIVMDSKAPRGRKGGEREEEKGMIAGGERGKYRGKGERHKGGERGRWWWW